MSTAFLPTVRVLEAATRKERGRYPGPISRSGVGVGTQVPGCPGPGGREVVVSRSHVQVQGRELGTLPCYLSNNAFEVTYPPHPHPHVNRHTPVITLPSPNFFCGR